MLLKKSIGLVRACVLLAVFVPFAAALRAGAAELLGSLKVTGDGVRVPVPDPGLVFKVGNTGRLFELREDRLVLAFARGGGPEVLCAVAWDAQAAPAWISNERVVTFGRIATSTEGSLGLVRGEVLPVVAMGQQDYRVVVTRFGRTVELDLPRSTTGLVFELASGLPTPVAVVPETVAAATNTGGARAQPGKPARLVIEGSGDFVMIRTNTPEVVAVPVPVPPVAVVPEQGPVAVAAPTNNGTAAPVREKKPEGFKLPLVLRDTTSLTVIFIFVALIVIFLLIQRKMIQRRSGETASAPAASAAPAAAGGSSLQMRKDQRERKREDDNNAASDGQRQSSAKRPEQQNAEGLQERAAPLKFASSKKNQTVILGQQNLVGGPPHSHQLAPMSASDTALIPSPSVLPETRKGGVLWIGKYQVEQLLGRGRMGVVYKAFQQDLNRTVALKLLAEGGHASEKSKERFMKEAQAIARLRHPNIITVYEVGEWEHQPYFTMDFVDGKSLDKMIVKQKLAPAEAARLARDIAVAVEYAHANGIIHRDLKPGNIILNTKGDPVITDFGLARQLDLDSMHAGDEILGTPAYMSPEQARGRSAETDARSDVYSVGAILFAMLTGDDPFGSNSLLDTLHKVIHDKPTAPDKSNPEIDPAISAICMKALSKDPKKRHQTAGELAADLARYLAVINSGQAPAAPTTTRPGLLARLFGRRA